MEPFAHHRAVAEDRGPEQVGVDAVAVVGETLVRPVGCCGPREAAAAIAFQDQGFRDGDGRVAITCEASPCLTPDAKVTVTASVTVPLPLIPAFARAVVPLEVPVSSTHVVSVDRFGAAP